MNEEEKWLKSKIENAVNENASFRLAEVKEKAVTADAVKALPAKKRSVLKTALTAVSCVVVALTIAALAASPFIFKNPPAAPGDGEEVTDRSKDDVSVAADVDPITEEISGPSVEESRPDEEPYPIEPIEYFNPICSELESICGISLADESIEDIYVCVCDLPSGEVYKGFSVYREGKTIAMKIDRNNGISETVYFCTDSEYYLKNVLGEDYSVQISSAHVKEITREIELISEFMRTSPLIVCKCTISDEAEFSSVEEILESVGCVNGNMKADEFIFRFDSVYDGSGSLGVSLGDSVKREHCTYEFACNASYEEVRSRFGKYEADADHTGSSTVFCVPASVLTDDDIAFLAKCIIPNMSGILRNESKDYEFYTLNLLDCDTRGFESMSVKEENGKYYLDVRLYKYVTELFGNVRVCSDQIFEISKDVYNEAKNILALSDAAKNVDFDIYFSVFSAVRTAYNCEKSDDFPSFNDTDTAYTLRNMLCGEKNSPIGGFRAVVGAEWSNEEPSLLRLKIRYPYGTITDAYIKYDFSSERDSIFFDNTSELDGESIKFINAFIDGAEEIFISPHIPDLSSCSDAKEAISFLFHYIFRDTAEIEVNFVALLKLETDEFYAVVRSESGLEYWLCIDEEVFGILAEKYGYKVNFFDFLTMEDVMLISRSYASLKSVLYELNSPVSPIPLPHYDPLTDAVNAITGKEYIAVKSIEMFKVTYDTFFRIDALDAEGGVTSYYVCGVGKDLFMACASGDDGVIADALMGCELRTYDECEEILNQIRPTEEDGVFAFDTFSFANDSELYKAGDPGVKTEGFVNTRPSGSDLPVSVLLEKAKAECTVEYDTVRIQFDPRSYVFRIDFYVKDIVGGDESVYVDLAGRTKLIVYGE